MQPGINITQPAREHGINDNLLFKWRRKHLEEQSHATLMPVEITETRPDIVDVTPLQPALTEPDNAQCCEVVFGDTVKLSGAVPPALLRMLFDELKRRLRCSPYQQ